MAPKTILTAFLTFILINASALEKNSSLNIDVIEEPSLTYVIEMDNGARYESAKDFQIDEIKFGRIGLRIYKKTHKKRKRDQDRFNERLIYSGIIEIPKNSIVFSQLRNDKLIVQRVMKKQSPLPPQGYKGMKPSDFQNLKVAIQHESFDKDKAAMMSNVATKGHLTSKQVLELMSLLSFDSYKLEFAKTAYRNTVDKQNYFMVRDGLTYSSNRKKLTEFITKQSKGNKKEKSRKKGKNR